MSTLKSYLIKIWTKILGVVVLAFGILFLYWLTTPSFVFSIASGLIAFMVILLILAGIILLLF
ncbi:MAG: hypothetical protein LZ163_01505 [Thaumarchaeota archaeon]|jgi:hypothetical protein|nr:hypothetical protein [Candidatus Terraquivivens yellowstonensis]MCL7398400.1 hypothetical protein [Candidatus Terraquivivens yellowstonensis]MCL7400231.1 hypothetical protein [Candidatus Terraquivivens yellowstonensis]